MIVGLVLVSLLIVTGQIVALVNSASGDRSAVTVPPHASVRVRIAALLSDALGPSDRGVPRYHIESLQPGRSLTVTWAINNDVSNGTVGDGAQTDAYDMVYNLATHVSLRQVTLIGTYPLGGHEAVVMRLRAGTTALHALQSIGSDGLDPQSFWPLLQHIEVNPSVAPATTQ